MKKGKQERGGEVDVGRTTEQSSRAERGEEGLEVETGGRRESGRHKANRDGEAGRYTNRK